MKYVMWIDHVISELAAFAPASPARQNPSTPISILENFLAQRWGALSVMMVSNLAVTMASRCLSDGCSHKPSRSRVLRVKRIGAGNTCKARKDLYHHQRQIINFPVTVKYL